MTGRQVRALRAVTASALTTLLAASAHTLGGDGAPTPAVLLIAALLSMPVALLLTGRRAGRVRTSLSVLGSQGIYHLVFAVFGMSAAFVGPAVHVHGAMVSGAAPISAASAGASTGPMMGLFAPSMLAMHAAAAVATIVLLRYGESLVRIVAEMVWPALVRRAFRPLASPTVSPVVANRPSPLVVALLSGIRGRAPPLAN